MSSARSIGILTVLNIGGALLALASSVVTAHFFGTSRGLEVFFAASTLESITLSISQGGQINQIWIPIYHQLKAQAGLRSARLAYATIVNWMLIWLIALSLVMWLLGPRIAPLLVPGFAAADQEMTSRMFRWMVPLLPLQILLSLQQGLSNAEKWFGRPEAFSMCTKLVSLVITVLLAPRLGIWALVWAMWIDAILLLGMYVWSLYQLGYRHRWVLRHRDVALNQLVRQLGSTLAYVLSTQAYSFMLNAGMSLLPQGAYATYKYVVRLCSKTDGIILRPVYVVYLTLLSEAKVKPAREAGELLRSAFSYMLLVCTTVIVATWVAAPAAVEALWGGKMFGEEQLHLAARLLILSICLLLPSGFGQLIRASVVARGSTARLFMAMACVQLICAPLAAYLPRRYGIVGAFGVLGLNAVAMVTVSASILRLINSELLLTPPWGTIWRWLVAGGVGYGLGTALGVLGNFGAAGRWGAGLSAGISAVLTSLATLSAAWCLGITDVKRLAGTALSRMTRNTSSAHT